MKQRYGAQFVTLDKCDVHGPNAHPVFRYLRSHTEELVDPRDRSKLLQIPWNFCKWIVDRQGRVHKYMDPTEQLPDVYELIESMLVNEKLTKMPVKKLKSSSKRHISKADFDRDLKIMTEVIQ